MNEAKQGARLFFDEDLWRQDHAGASVLRDIEGSRIVYQRYAAIDNYRRLIACLVPPHTWCSHTTGYLRQPKYDVHVMLTLMNSEALEWRFGLTSTNNNVNAYEVEALSVPRFRRLEEQDRRDTAIDWSTWDRFLAEASLPGVQEWGKAVLTDLEATPQEATAWPNSIHDALAAAGKEMSRLAEERQRLTSEFSDWLTTELGIDEDRFTGVTRLRGGQADFDEMGWDEFLRLLERNRGAYGADINKALTKVERQYEKVSGQLRANRTRFAALDAAIDRVVWQLVGLNSDGSLPEDNETD